MYILLASLFLLFDLQVRNNVVHGLEREEMGMFTEEHRVSFWHDEHVLEIGSGDGWKFLNIVKITALYNIKTGKPLNYALKNKCVGVSGKY